MGAATGGLHGGGNTGMAGDGPDTDPGGASSGGSGGEVGEDGGDAGGSAGGSDVGAGGESSADELENIFNLVDAGAAAELAAHLVAGERAGSIWAPGLLPLCVNGFLEQYQEEYDFLFFMTDRDIATNTYGIFHVANQEIMPGTGRDIRLRRPGYKTNGRIKGVAGFKYVPGGYGPFAHEMLHYWANQLDPSFGLGIGLDFNSRAHWGYAGIHGQLGGYDPAQFECETPARAVPPNCTATSTGRYRYVTPFFGVNANYSDIPYAPFELYLMGLLPRAQAPSEIHVLENAQRISSGTNMVLEADGINTVRVADIVARHGEVELLDAESRSFKLAMIVVSASPASESVLREIAHAVASFGNRTNDADLPSFESLTGGRATLDTRLGPRRLPTDDPPTETPLPECNVLAQDCDPPGAGCYLNGQMPFCARSGGRDLDEACTAEIQCAPGSTCTQSPTRSSYFCAPFCEPNDATSPIYCRDLCSQYIVLAKTDGGILGGRCTPD